jgi:activator of Hsp90 ATPase-like protein
MTHRSYTTTFIVDQTPAAVFTAITNPRAWWSQEITGRTDTLGETFRYHFKDFHRCEIAVKELIPGQKVLWTVLSNYFSFTEDRTERTGTDIVFEISSSGGQTVVTFTHVGLVPEYECYNACSEGWRSYIIGSLHDLITTGRGRPNVGEAITDSELALA